MGMGYAWECGGGSNLGKEVRLGLGGWMIDGLSSARAGIENWDWLTLDT